MTFRAIRILKVDLILAEDTRTSGKLLKHFEIGTAITCTTNTKLSRISFQIKAGENIALISDANTRYQILVLLTRLVLKTG
jgi:16S rRNA (cytidine1402-2'-O)-methyltransferase